MKTKTLAIAVAFTSLLTLGGTAFAAGDPHDAYNRAFLGQSPSTLAADTMGKAAYGIPTNASAWSGHDTYNRALLGAWPSKPVADAAGKAAYGTSSSSIDGLAAYRGAFRGD